MRGSNEILQAAAEVHKDYSFGSRCLKLLNKSFQLYDFGVFTDSPSPFFHLGKDMCLLAFGRCSFCAQ